MTDEGTRKRISKRHKGRQQSVELLMVKLPNFTFEKKINESRIQKFKNICEPVEDDEEGVINIEVDDSMSEEDVMDLILRKCQNLNDNKFS